MLYTARENEERGEVCKLTVIQDLSRGMSRNPPSKLPIWVSISDRALRQLGVNTLKSLHDLSISARRACEYMLYKSKEQCIRGLSKHAEKHTLLNDQNTHPWP
jgi:hypothetical protein